MTVIVGVVEPSTGDVIIGGDSSGVNNTYDMVVVKGPKVFLNGEFAIGFAGSFRWGQLFRFAKFPRCRTKDIDHYMAVSFANTLRGAARELGCLQERHGEEIGGWCLVGFRGRLFTIQDTFEAIESVDGAMAIGLGAPYALGALRASKGTGQARVTDALRAAEYYCSGVRGPFTYVRLENHANSRGKTGSSRARDSQRNRGVAGRATRAGKRRARSDAAVVSKRNQGTSDHPDGSGRHLREVADNHSGDSQGQERPRRYSG